MKALLCKAFGPVDTLVVEDVAAPAPGPGEVLIEVYAAGVNFPDGLMVQGKYQLKPAFPFSPGLEGAGIVRAIGEGVTSIVPGTRVIGFPGHGAFAGEMLVPAAKVFPIPDGMDFATAGGFLITYATSFHALRDRAVLKPGETLLVLGAAGGVGLAAVELGKAMGARVIAAASSTEKLALVRDHGADVGINYATEDLRCRVKEITAGKGVDVIYDPVGGDYAEPMVRSLAWGGRYLVIGFAAGDIPRIATNLLLLKSASLVGVFWGASVEVDPEHNARNVATLLEWCAVGRLRPYVSQTYPLSQAATAIAHVMERKALGKVVIVRDAP